ncbi:hypothetical protein Hanom_Chr06g00565801 [Helianthus anomalus]
MANAGVEALIPAVVGITDRNCKDAYEKGLAAVVPEETTEVPAKPGGASASNSRSRDLVMAGEADMVETELVSGNGLLVPIS